MCEWSTQFRYSLPYRHSNVYAKTYITCITIRVKLYKLSGWPLWCYRKEMVSKLAEHYVRLGMSNEMRQDVERWRAENRDPETGKVVSFSEALRRLIQAGLSKPPSS